MATPEGTFKRQLKERFTALFGKGQDVLTTALAGSFGQVSGLPDRIFGAQGRLAWVEAKVAGSHHLTPIQELQLKRLAACGQTAVVLTLHDHRRPSQDRRVQLTRFSPEGPTGHCFVSWELTRSKLFWEGLLDPERHPEMGGCSHA